MMHELILDLLYERKHDPMNNQMPGRIHGRMHPFKKTVMILGMAFLLWGTDLGSSLGPVLGTGPGTCLAGTDQSDEHELTIRARTALAKAQSLMEKKETARAKALLQEFIRNHEAENHHFVEFTLAGLFYNEDCLEEARTHFKKSVELNPNYGPGWQNLGKVCFDLKHFNEAAQAMENTYRLCKRKDPVHLFHAAVAHISANCPQKAMDHMVFLTSGSVGPPEANWVKILTNLAIELKCPEKALATVERLLNAPDPDPVLWKLASNLYLTMNNHAKSAEALTVYSMVQSLSPGEQTRLAGLYHCIGIPARAADHYEKALKTNPNLRLYEQLVSARMEAKDWKKALAAVDRGIAAYPDSRVLWKLKGWIAYEGNQFGPAATAFSRAVELDKNDKKACFMKGLCTSKTGSLETARQALEQASSYPEYKTQALALLREINKKQKQP